MAHRMFLKYFFGEAEPRAYFRHPCLVVRKKGKNAFRTEISPAVAYAANLHSRFADIASNHQRGAHARQLWITAGRFAYRPIRLHKSLFEQIGPILIWHS